MSINKQLYFGILGISFLFCFLCLLLILLSSLKLFYLYNDNIKSTYNDLDTNIVSLNAEYADISSQLLLYQGNFETYFLRKYYNILTNNEIGQKLLDTIKIGQDQINSFFYYYTDNTDSCQSEDSKCYFIFPSIYNSSPSNKDNVPKKELYILKPTIEISLDTYAFNKDNLVIFDKFNFYDSRSNTYISYKYNKTDIQKNLNDKIPPNYIMVYIFEYIKMRIPLIETLNEIKIEDFTYKEFFNDNLIMLFAPEGYPIYIDPFSKIDKRTLHFGSFLFKDNYQNNKISIEELNSTFINNYMSFDLKFNYLSYLLLNFIKVNGNYIFILDNGLSFSASKSICRFNDYINFTYSDDSLNEKLDLNVDFLKMDELQYELINKCLVNSDIQEIVSSDVDYNYKLKILYDMYEYNEKRDFNNDVKIKILRELSPNKFTTTFLNHKFYHSFSYYFLVFKIYNNINVLKNLIDRIIYRYISYIMLYLFVLWIIIFIYVCIKLYLIADRISSPIKKLIKNISLSHANEIKLEQIYYEEDKDINDLFQLSQKLIIGGFKKKINAQKKNKLNVYNNISKIKTNNMAINENQIIRQRNQKYNEIFEKGENKEIINDSFKNDIYYKYKNKEFDKKIKNYESKKLKKLSADKKEEFEKIKNKDNEYKMFYYINKEIESWMPYNSLYKFYYEKFAKKSNKKKKK